MEKIKIDDIFECATPDTVRVDAWGINAYCHDFEGEPFPIIYTERLLKQGLNETVFVSCEYGEFHNSLSSDMYEALLRDYDVSYIKSRDSDTYVRIWKNYNIITVWSEGEDNVEKLKKVVNLFKNGNYLSFYENENGDAMIVPKENNYMHKGINFNDLVFYWETTEYDDEIDDYSKYVCRAPLSELFNKGVNVDIDDSKSKLFHLMTPQEKAQAIQNDEELKKEREEYAKEGDRAWKAKYGNIDPAQYHLLMYQENKKKNTMKINESDIKKMVNKCVKHLLKEDFLGFSGKDFENMGLKNPSDNYQVNIEELKEKCSEFLQALDNFSTYLNGMESELDDVEDTPGFISNLNGKHTWNSHDDWNYDDEESLLQTLREVDTSLYKVKSSLQDVIDYN